MENNTYWYLLSISETGRWPWPVQEPWRMLCWYIFEKKSFKTLATANWYYQMMAQLSCLQTWSWDGKFWNSLKDCNGYAPMSNGNVEQVIWTIKQAITKSRTGIALDWDETLQDIPFDCSTVKPEAVVHIQRTQIRYPDFQTSACI